MIGVFNDPLYGKRNRIVALVLFLVVAAFAGVVWWFAGVVIALVAAFAAAIVMFGPLAFWWPGGMWPVPNLWDRLREYERRNGQR